MLGYCTNVHSGVTFSSVIENLKTYSSSVQQHFKKTIGVGLWFSDIASREVDTNLLVDTLQELNCKHLLLMDSPFQIFIKKSLDILCMNLTGLNNLVLITPSALRTYFQKLQCKAKHAFPLCL